MTRFENLKLFIILLFVLALTTLIYNFQNPLFRLKLQLMMNGYKAEPQAKNTEVSESKILSIYKLVNVPSRTPQIVLPQPTNTYSEPTKTVPTAHQTPGVSNRLTAPQTPGVSKLVWKAIFKGVEAAENPQTGSLSVKIAAGTEYTTRSYTLKDGQTISVIVPIFKD